MTERHFTLNTREEVARFEILTQSYAGSRAKSPLKHISLTAAYDYCQKRSDGGKLFAALLDISINFILLYCDLNSLTDAWRTHSRQRGGEISVLESEEVFIAKMDAHRHSTSFVLRYRALWDKVLGLFVLFFAPSQYENFVGAKSRRAAFRKIASGISAFPDDFAEQVGEMLTRFDGKFRTPEIHGTGSLRKWSFTMEPWPETPSIELLGYWNAINQLVYAVGKMFDAQKSDTLSPDAASSTK